MKRGLIPYVDKEQTSKYLFQMAKLLENGCYQQEMLLKAVHIIDEALDEYALINIRTKDIPYINNKMEEKIRNYLVETVPERLSITLRSQLLLIYNDAYLGKFLGSHIYMKVVEFVLNYNALKSPETKNNNA
jgi:hypothetical protein